MNNETWIKSTSLHLQPLISTYFPLVRIQLLEPNISNEGNTTGFHNNRSNSLSTLIKNRNETGMRNINRQSITLIIMPLSNYEYQEISLPLILITLAHPVIVLSLPVSIQLSSSIISFHINHHQILMSSLILISFYRSFKAIDFNVC